MMPLRRTLPALLLLSLPVAATAQGPITVSVGTTSSSQIAPGAKLAVPLLVDLTQAGGVTVATAAGRLLWGASLLTLDSIVGAGFGTLTTVTSRAAQGEASFNVTSPTGTNSSFTLATMHFTATGTGGTRVDFDMANGSNQFGTQIPGNGSVRNLDVCIAPPSKWGDANGDTLVNIIDAQQVARASIGLSVAKYNFVKYAGDVNADAVVNVLDAQQLARFAVGLSTSPRTTTPVFVPPVVDGLTIKQGTAASVAVGSTLQLFPRPTTTGGGLIIGCAPVTWTSSDTTKAKVSVNGAVTGVAVGSATLTATSDDKTVAFAVTVATSAALAPATMEIVQGDGQAAYGALIVPIDPVVRVKDAAGKVMPGVEVEFSIPSNSAGTVNGPSAGQTGALTWTIVTTDSLGLARLPHAWTTTNSSFTPSLLQATARGTSVSVTFTANVLPSSNIRHHCMLIGGAAYCWGEGARGQLGTGTSTGSSVPVAVTGGITFSRLSDKTMGDHMCGVATDGKAYCWGQNAAGQLGDSSRVDRNVPTLVAGGLSWSRISTGVSHTCGVTTAGAAYCWGANQYGQIGDSTVGVMPIKPQPVKMPAGVTFTELSAARNFNCALTGAGDLYCWGYNGEGELGDGATTDRLVPTKVGGAPAFIKLSAGVIHSCALTSAGAAYCWGANGFGQLGNGIFAPTNVANTVTAVLGGHVFTEIVANNQVSCAAKADGSIYCWGLGNTLQLGDGSSTTAGSRAVPNLAAIAGSQLFMSNFDTCLLASGGVVPFCWGNNSVGQIGDGTANATAAPTSAVFSAGTRGTAVSIAPSLASYNQSGSAGAVVASSPSATVRDAFGNPVAGVTVTFTVSSGGGTVQNATNVTNASGVATAGTWTLGTSAGTNQLLATIPVGAGTAKAIFIAVGSTGAVAIQRVTPDSTFAGSVNLGGGAWDHEPVAKVVDGSGNPVADVPVTFTSGSQTYAVRTDAAGLATMGQLTWTAGTTVTATAAGVSGNVTFVLLSSGTSTNNRTTNCALAASGTAYCWGSGGTAGALGDGTTTFSRNYAAPVAGAVTFASMATGSSNHHCALTAAGAAYCWGLGDGGQLGDGAGVNRTVPTAVAGGLAFRQLVTQAQTTCGLTLTNQLYCWGWMQGAGFGDPTLRLRRRFSPQLVNTGALTFVQIALNDDGFCGLTSDGTIYCAAYNANGQRADGTFAMKRTLDPIVGGLSFSKVAGGTQQFCAISIGGRVYCWGSAFLSGLGDGESTSKNLPTPIAYDKGPFTELTLGNGTGCALRLDGTAVCWGNNGNGQLGRDYAGNIEPVPDDIEDMLFSRLLPFMFRSACGQTANGMMYCWGSNQNRELGDSTTVLQRASPVAVVGWPDGPALGVPVALRLGTAWAAANFTGSVNTVTSSVPQVIVLDRFNKPVQNVDVTFEVVFGGGTLVGGAVKTDAAGVASATSWTLGPNVQPNTLIARVNGLPPVVLIANIGAPATSVVIQSGNNQVQVTNGAFGSPLSVLVRDAQSKPVSNVTVGFVVTSGGGTLSASSASTNSGGIASVTMTTPTSTGANVVTATVTGITPVVFNLTTVVNPTGQTQCELTTTGAAYCWGDNRRGQIGDATTTDRNVPTAVSGGKTFSVLAEGSSDHICGLVAGAAWCWGSNSFGELGDGSTTDRTSPVAVSGTLAFTKIATNRFTSCGLTAASALYCWGYSGVSFFGDSINGAIRTTPTLVNTGGVNFTEIALGDFHICGLTSGGQLYCWGANDAGQLATGTLLNRSVATQINDGRTYKAISAGTRTTCALTTTNQAYCWGINTAGTIGDNTILSPRTAPVAVSGGLTFKSISVGFATTCAVTSANVGYCWGDNPNGQVGDQTSGNTRLAPTAIGGSVAVTSIRAHSFLSCGRATSGVPFCWGDNSRGGIGDGTTVQSSTPVPTKWVEGTAGVAVAIVANGATTTSYAAGGTIVSFGSVIVKDFAGNPVTGATVNFALTGGGGSITGAAQTTNSSGIATLGGWTLGTAAGANTVTATSGTLPGSPVTFTATGLVPTQVVVGVGGGQSAAAGAALATAPSVQVKNASNVGVPGVTVTFVIATGGGKLNTTLTSVTAVTNSSGFAGLSNWILGPNFGTQTLTATATGLTGSPLTFSATATTGTATWTGTSGNNWYSSTNWTGGVVPTTATSVVIPVTTFAPFLSADASVKSVSVADGATLTMSNGATLSPTNSFSLTVADSVVTGYTGGIVNCNGTTAPGIVKLTGTANIIRGKICAVSITGGTTLSDSTIITEGNVSVSGASAQLTLNGKKMRVATNIFSTATGGKLIMNNANDSLLVSTANFAGGASVLSNGYLKATGQFQQSVTAGAFNATGTHLTELAHTGASTLFSDTVTSGFATLRVTGSTTFINGGRIANDLIMTGTGQSSSNNNVRLKIGGALRGGLTTQFNMNLGSVVEIGGVFADSSTQYFADTTVFTGAATQIIPDRVGPTTTTFKSIRVAGTVQMKPVTSPGSYALGGKLIVSGTGALRIGDASTTTTVTVADSLVTMNSGTLSMQETSTTATVAGSVRFGGGSTTGLLPSGTLIVGGNFSQSGTASSYAPGVSHTLRMTNANASIGFANTTSSYFSNFEFGAATQTITALSDIPISLKLSVGSSAGSGNKMFTATGTRYVIAGGLNLSTPSSYFFNNVGLRFVDGSASTTFGGATFQNFGTGFTGVQFEVTRSSPTSLSFSALTFADALGTGGRYVRNSGATNVSIVSSTPASGTLNTNYDKTSTGTITWP